MGLAAHGWPCRGCECGSRQKDGERMGWDMLSPGEAQKTAESDLRLCCTGSSSQRKFCGTGVLWGSRGALG